MVEIKSVAIIGCGLMGTGIAQACALAGLKTIAIKATPGDCKPAERRVLGALDKAVEKGKLAPEARDRAVARLEFSNDLSRVAEADLVIESAAESVGAKQDLLARVERLMKPNAVLGSNTSSLRLSILAEVLARPERFIGLHFFSPANVMKLVELGPTAATLGEVGAAVSAFCTQIGKLPVTVGDHPGYIVNRLLVPYMLHAIETLEAGVAGPEAIDTAMKLGCGHPMGPLALADMIGLDVVFAMAKSLYEEHHDARFRCPSLLRRLVLAASLGRKTGAGFYLYDGSEPRPNPAVFEFEKPSQPRAASAPAA
jgi:3-hydroxybutyryl-CoA dehydrogenase